MKKKNGMDEATGLDKVRKIKSSQGCNRTRLPSTLKNAFESSPGLSLPGLDVSNHARSSSYSASGNMHGKLISPNTHHAAVAEAKNAVRVEMQESMIDILQQSRAEQHDIFKVTLRATQEATKESYRQIQLHNVATAYQRFDDPSPHHSSMFRGLTEMHSTTRSQDGTCAPQGSYTTNESTNLRPSTLTSSITVPRDVEEPRITYGKYYDGDVFFH